MVIHECHILELRIEMKVKVTAFKQQRERPEIFRPDLCSALPVELSGKLGDGRYIGLLTHPHSLDDRALHRHCGGNALITNG